MKDVFGKALFDFHRNDCKSPLLLHNDYGEPEIISIEHFFSKGNAFSDLDFFALTQVKGKILDAGAASGRHSYYLQNQGHDVTAMDVSPFCCKLMKEVGVNKIIKEDIFYYKKEKFDTILMLMNGIGITGSIAGLKKLLAHLKSMVTPSGYLLIDSSDITYIYKDNPLPTERYFGQLFFQHEYNNEMSNKFSWLYIDQNELMDVAYTAGWHCRILFEDETDAYLARLEII